MRRWIKRSIRFGKAVGEELCPLLGLVIGLRQRGAVDRPQNLFFLVIRIALKHLLKGKPQTIFPSDTSLFHNPFGKHSRGFDKGRIVQQHQGRHRRIRPRPLRRAFLATRRIHRLHHRMQELALPVHVEAATPLPLIVVLLVGAGRKIQMAIVPRRLVGLHTGTTDLVHQQPTDRQRIVPHHLRRQAVARLPGKQLVVGITLQQFRRRHRRLPIGPARHQQPHHVLHIPAAVHEFNGQAIQQFGIGGRLALPAKVIQAARDARAKVEIPKAIGHHPRGQSAAAALCVREPLGQIETCRTGGLCFHCAHERGHGRLNELSTVIHPVATRLHANRSGLVHCLRDHHTATTLLNGGQLSLQRLGIGGLALQQLLNSVPLFLIVPGQQKYFRRTRRWQGVEVEPFSALRV